MKKKTFAGPFGGFRPTEMERRYGRLLRAPDHDSSTGGGGSEDEGSDDGADDQSGGGNTEVPASLDAARDALKAAEARAAKAEREAKKARETAKKFEGIDPEKARENEKKVKEAEANAREADRKKAEAEGNFEKLRQLQNEEYEAGLKAEREARAAAEDRARAAEERANRALVTTAFAGSTFILNDTIFNPVKAARMFGDHVEVEGDEVVVYDGPRGSKRAKVMDSRGNALPFDQAIRKVIEADPDKDLFLRNKIKPGVGSKSEDGKPAAVLPKDRLSRLAAGLKAMKEDK